MSVRNTEVEIARAKLITGLIVLAVMAGACAAPMIERTKTAHIPAFQTLAQIAGSAAPAANEEGA